MILGMNGCAAASKKSICEDKTTRNSISMQPYETERTAHDISAAQFRTPVEKNRAVNDVTSTHSEKTNVDSQSDHSEVRYGDLSTQYPTHGNTLSAKLVERGVSLKTLKRIRLIGDESSGTSGLYVDIEEKGELEYIWIDYLTTAEPYKYWLPSGNRYAEIYVGNNKEPAELLRVNETDRTELVGHPVTFMCRGFHDYILHTLKKNGERMTEEEINIFWQKLKFKQ